MARVKYDTRIPAITATLDERIEVALKAGAEQIEQDAKSRAPVDSGRLRDSIHADRTGNLEYSVIAGGDGVFYGHLVEFGTSKTPARPFLIPAGEAKRESVVASVMAVLRSL